MKKAYETPSVEMIAFRYRDQVVAASGVTAMENVSGDLHGWDAFCNIIKQADDYFGFGGCEDKYLS